MEFLIERYSEIINSLNALKYPRLIPSSKKLFKKIFIEEIEKIHNIAINIHEFKNNGGDIHHDYGQGIIIKEFFLEFNLVLDDLKKFRRVSLIKLDQLVQDKLGACPFQLLEQEYNKLIARDLKSEPIKTQDSITQDYKIKVNKYGVIIQKEDYVERIKQKKFYHKFEHCNVL